MNNLDRILMIFFIILGVGGWFVGGSVYYLLQNQITVSFGGESLEFKDYKTANTACLQAGGTIQCGPVCTCNLPDLEKLNGNLDYCKEQLTGKTKENVELKEAGNEMWNEFLSCYWSYYCAYEYQDCLTTYEFTKSEVENMNAICYAASSFEKQNELFGN